MPISLILSFCGLGWCIGVMGFKNHGVKFIKTDFDKYKIDKAAEIEQILGTRVKNENLVQSLTKEKCEIKKEYARSKRNGDLLEMQIKIMTEELKQSMLTNKENMKSNKKADAKGSIDDFLNKKG